MSHRLQVSISPKLDAELRKAAQRARMSKGEWINLALEDAVKRSATGPDPLIRLAALGGPTGDIHQMLSEIEAGRD